MKNPSGIKAFGTHLRQLRDAQKLSQQELADLSDLAKITIQRIENAKYCATIDVLISISMGLKITLPELVNFQTQKLRKK
ncbi:MAG: helix-turn-helix transcriptional regulator [Cyclobacteriaceae bacterium]|nr:helix-turn-helix transcriptional regulator [Cyclobacteriaceae bacterium]